MQKVVCLSQWWPQLLRENAMQFCSLKFARRKWKGKVNLNFLLDQGRREKQHFSPVRDKMSLSKVMPSSAESKSGKIFANSEQKETLMAVYLADNYPDTSTLEQVAISIRVRLDILPDFSKNCIFRCRFPTSWASAWIGCGNGSCTPGENKSNKKETKE